MFRKFNKFKHYGTKKKTDHREFHQGNSQKNKASIQFGTENHNRDGSLARRNVGCRTLPKVFNSPSSVLHHNMVFFLTMTGVAVILEKDIFAKKIWNNFREGNEEVLLNVISFQANNSIVCREVSSFI